MLDGERPAECEYCWKIEDMGPEFISDRVHKTQIYEDSDVAALQHLDPQADVMLKTLEISFDRTCNFACSYCNPMFSTTWVKDLKQNGFYENIRSDARGHFVTLAERAEPFKPGEFNPYIDAFWRWWPELSTNLEELRITGGEPLMSSEVWKLFTWFRENPSAMRFAVNSNLGAKQELIDRLVEAAQHVKNFHLYTSCEAYGAAAEYTRDGLDYFKWYENLERMIVHGNAKQVCIMMTINVLSLPSLTRFLDDIMRLKVKYGSRPSLSLNILRFPNFQNVLVLPKELRNKFASELESWTIDNGLIPNYDDKPALQDHELDQISRVVSYLRNVENPQYASQQPVQIIENDFKSFYMQYDVRRNKNFIATFPELADWYNSLELLKNYGT